MRTIHTDVAVIGAGTAGLSAYRSAKAEGRKAVIIEGGEYGTTCARVGCMPSKLLIAAAEAAHAASHAEPFGVHVDGVRIDGEAVMQRVRSERDRFVGFVVDGVHALPEADRLIGHVRFIDDRLLQVGQRYARACGERGDRDGFDACRPRDSSWRRRARYRERRCVCMADAAAQRGRGGPGRDRSGTRSGAGCASE